jgi:CHAD domain-containing protein
MSIRLNHQEAFFPGLQRLILAECETALEQLRGAATTEQRHSAVHETRKAFKKIRAAIRLVRDAVPFYKETNVFFRDQARKISAVRDATAHLETLHLLEKQYAKVLRKQAFAKIRETLEERRAELAHAAFVDNQHLESIAQALTEKMDEIRNWDITIDRYQQIRPSIRRVYNRGYRALHRARKTRRMEDFHQWRKRAKYLRYQLDMLHHLWPSVMEAWEDELHEVTDLVGTAHDCYELRETLLELAPSLLDDPAGLLLHALLDKQQQYLEEHVLLLGEKCYAADPDTFCDRLKVYWDKYREAQAEAELPGRGELEY